MIDYVINEEENLLYCNIEGRIRLIDFTDYVSKVVVDKKFHPKINTIIKISEDTEISFANEAAGFGQFFSQHIQKRKGVAWAFVMSNNITMGLARLFMEEVDTTPIDLDYFNTEEEAKKWIASLA